MSSLVLPGVVDLAAAPGLASAVVPTHPGLISFVSPDDDAPSSESSSSIGSPSSDEEEDEDRRSDGQNDDEAHSKSSSLTTVDDTTGSSSLGSLSSLEDSLPIKKGLSTHFNGKSRSFSNLSECAGGNAVDLAKQENPFNKRRRIQIVSKMSYKRRASCSSLISTALLPPLLSPEHALHEETEVEEEEENDDINGSDDDDEGNDDINGSDDDDGDISRRRCFASMAPNPHGGNFYHEKKKRIGKSSALKSPRSFPLFDLRYV